MLWAGTVFASIYGATVFNYIVVSNFSHFRGMPHSFYNPKIPPPPKKK